MKFELRNRVNNVSYTIFSQKITTEINEFKYSFKYAVASSIFDDLESSVMKFQ